MAFTTEDWIISTNVLVAMTSIIAAAASEHDTVKAMRDTVLGVMRTIMHPPTKKIDHPEEKEKKDGQEI